MMIVSSSTYLRIVIYFILIQLMVVILMEILMLEMAQCTCVAQSRGHGQVAGAALGWSLRSLPVHWPRLVTGAWV